MSRLIVNGGNPLNGSIRANGAKNSILPILAATIINGGENIIHNCPDLKDVHSAIAILRHLGCRVEYSGGTIVVDSAGMDRWDIPDDLMREMRSSVIFLGPILARCGKARMTYPGGCELGPRPIDLHLDALSKLGVHIQEEGGEITCECGPLQGRQINLSLPSVGATENIMLCATACQGTTRIVNAAREPEIWDLQQFLQKAGAQVQGAGQHDITIQGGVPTRQPTEHSVIPDRIESATYLCACAAAGGEICVQQTIPAHFAAVTELLAESGCQIQVGGQEVRLRAPGRLHSVRPVRTMPYPGFPTDAQSPLMATLCLAQGTTMFSENIFESRYRHCAELCRMGADIRVEGRVALVTGVDHLTGASVKATDLRGGAAMVVAALAAQSASEITQIDHIDRGYDHIERAFAALGADIKRQA
ncbi:MAG TPA: UDP-N-acetylglucosamine 1-carboxyvinyltransferase [Firmicutes bacterium]|nr:UDP-N-acetylglucosamine 1-carboxyvinyltransferase [Bacillota bacterium]